MHTKFWVETRIDEAIWGTKSQTEKEMMACDYALSPAPSGLGLTIVSFESVTYWSSERILSTSGNVLLCGVNKSRPDVTISAKYVSCLSPFVCLILMRFLVARSDQFDSNIITTNRHGLPRCCTAAVSIYEGENVLSSFCNTAATFGQFTRVEWNFWTPLFCLQLSISPHPCSLLQTMSELWSCYTYTPVAYNARAVIVDVKFKLARMVVPC
jgi:hypothetical protein